jgi:hypothetical protein
VIIREFSTSSTVIGVLKVARGFFAAHSRCTTETIASCLCVQAIGRHVAQRRDREQSRRPHRPIGLLELAGEARGRDDIAGASGAAALAISDQHRLAEPPNRSHF